MSQVETPLYQTTGSELRMELNSQWQLLNPRMTHWLNCDFCNFDVGNCLDKLTTRDNPPVVVQLPRGFE